MLFKSFLRSGLGFSGFKVQLPARCNGVLETAVIGGAAVTSRRVSSWTRHGSILSHRELKRRVRAPGVASSVLDVVLLPLTFGRLFPGCGLNPKNCGHSKCFRGRRGGAWCHQGSFVAACWLAAADRLPLPLPPPVIPHPVLGMCKKTFLTNRTIYPAACSQQLRVGDEPQE